MSTPQACAYSCAERVHNAHAPIVIKLDYFLRPFVIEALGLCICLAPCGKYLQFSMYSGSRLELLSLRALEPTSCSFAHCKMQHIAIEVVVEALSLSILLHINSTAKSLS